MEEELDQLLGTLEESIETKIQNNNRMIKTIQQQLRRLRAQLGHQRLQRNEAMMLHMMTTPDTPGDIAQREQILILSDNCVRALECAIRLGQVNLQAKLIIKRTLLVEMAWFSF